MRRLPLPDATFVEIVAIDILEHLEQAETQTTLAEWSRVLAPDGVLSLRVPSFPHLAAMALNNTGRDLETDRQVIHFAYGTQAYRGDYHLTSFTPILLSHYLATAGLFVHRVSVRDDWLYEIDARRIPAPTRVSWPMPSLAVDAMYQTWSWRVTAPLRAVRRLTRWMG